MNAKRLTTPTENVQKLQVKLGHAAKESKKRRFHALYDKVYRMDILWEAWRKVRANKGAAGVDGETLADIEKQGEHLFLHECQRLLKEGKYQPQPVRRQYIPKKDGKLRPLGIPHEYFQHIFSKGAAGRFVLYSPEGQVIYEYAPKGVSLESQRTREVQNVISSAGWKLIYTFSTKEMTAEISGVFSFYTFLLSVFILSFLVMSVFIARTLHMPLNKLRKTAEQFGSGNREIRFPVKGQDEVAVLGRAFNRMLGRIDVLIAEVKQEQKQKRIIELDALFSQIRPHFLLNTLNSIKCNQAAEGQTVKSRQIDALMSMLRACMRVNERWSLKQECKLLEDYVEIMKMRNDISLELHICLDEQAEKLEVPRLLLQPLVENAIVHGFSEPSDAASVWVIAAQDSGRCRIEIKDNGAGMSDESRLELRRQLLEFRALPNAASQRIGLLNVYNRLRLTYGSGVDMDVCSNEYNGVSIVLEMERGADHDEGHAGG
ncbi:sensor histidine kinase [Paenibacillus sp. YN15]|uniref:sensor histidine kinase n=1 Tax=Paenibacillus sp. YN15 TaxID=1742774 RepID=UPI000DCCB53A|nr:sensor histidine kinase [Paenibacillus sp. YN15]RAV04742.1 hypothetical protein DQG13_05955 [Paenibacillus sp. YN15]